jgi:hypothetical protein
MIEIFSMGPFPNVGIHARSLPNRPHSKRKDCNASFRTLKFDALLNQFKQHVLSFLTNCRDMPHIDNKLAVEKVCIHVVARTRGTAKSQSARAWQKLKKLMQCALKPRSRSLSKNQPGVNT